MRMSALVVLITAAVSITGCGELLSTEPLATKEDTLFDAGLLGTWFDQDETVITVKSEKRPVYDILFIGTEEGNRIRLSGQLVPFGDRQILDVSDWEGGPFSIQAHVWIHVQKKGDGIHLQFLDSKWLQSKLQESGLPFFLADSHPAITASTAKVREFVKEYGTKPEAGGGTIDLIPFKKDK
jgi:hypothetical protein